MSSKEIEETEEAKNSDKMMIIVKSILYAEYDGKELEVLYTAIHSFIYYFLKDIWLLIFRPMFIDIELVCQMALRIYFMGGINAILGKENALCIEELCLKKGANITIRKMSNKGYKLILTERDFKELFTVAGVEKQFGNCMSQNLVSKFSYK